MHVHVPSYLALVMTMLPAAAATEPAGGAPTAATTQQQRTQQQPEQADLVAIGELIGWTVTTREGERVGTLEYVAVDLDGGRISHLVIDSTGGDFDRTGASRAPGAAAGQREGAEAGQREEDLLIVPWTAARLVTGSEVAEIAATGAHITSAPRLKRQELNRLSEPTLASHVIDYWAPASDMAALEAERGASARATTSGRDAGSGQIRADAPMETEPDTASGRPDAGAGRAGSPMALVGQEVVATVVPPMFQLGEDLEGAHVTDRSGQTVGRIKRIMVDTGTGDAAFAVIEKTSAGAAPVPLQALEWTAKGTTMFTADRSALQPDPALTDEPGEVSRSQLAALYRRFDVDPYWKHGSAGSRGTKPNSTEIPR